MENTTFSYKYSAKTNKEIEEIRNRYLSQSEDKLSRLRKLDYSARCAGIAEGLTVGISGALVFGIGMCFGLGAIGHSTALAIIFCIAGIATMIPAYPICRHIAKKKRDKLIPEILHLAEELTDYKK